MSKKQKNKRKPVRYDCYHCDAFFQSWQARDKHIAEEHKPPQKTTESVLYEESRTLKNADRVQLGDQIEFPKWGVVTKLIRTEGSQDIEVTIAVMKNTWQKRDN